MDVNKALLNRELAIDDHIVYVEQGEKDTLFLGRLCVSRPKIAVRVETIPPSMASVDCHTAC